MDNTSQRLLNGYIQMIDLTKQQLSIVTMPRYDEQLVELQQLEEKKINCRVTIEQLSTVMLENEKDVSSNRNMITAYLEQLQIINEQLYEKITEWYIEDSKSMKQVSNQRKTLQAYGGLYNSDIVSYYFDEKK